MHFEGVIIGAATFAVIGVFHPLVIKAEYYWGTRSKWAFGIAGIVCIVGAVCTEGFVLSTVLGVVGFSCLWSIHELSQQYHRVERGWFAKGPGHTASKKSKMPPTSAKKERHGG